MAAAPTYRVSDVLRRTGLTRRAIRHYVQMKLIAGAKARGPGTVYTHEQLVRLQVIALLRRRDRMSLPKIRQRLAGLTLADLEALLPKPPPPPPESAPKPEAIAASAVLWQHVPLLPGLELRIRDDAGPVIHRLAREIATTYGSTKQPEAPRTAPKIA
jgi:DNA-binding transcriptional MerR regulator